MNQSFRKKLPERLDFVLQWKFAGTLFLTNSVIVIFFLLQEISGIDSLRELFVLIVYLMFYIQPIGFSMAYLMNAVPYENFKSKILVWLTAIPAATLAGWIGSIIGIHLIRMILKIHAMPPATWQGRLEQCLYFLLFGGLSSVFFELRGKLGDTVQKLAAKEVNEQKLQRMRIEAELEALRTKVNPHFLFNTLNSIASLIQSQPDAAEEMVQKLSVLFRYSLDSGNHQFIKLEEEVDVIRKYLDIEKIRLGDRLSCTIKMDPALKNVAIPPLLLQPLIENAVKHGIGPKPRGGAILLSFNRKDKNCLIQIKDTGMGYQENEDNKRGFGLKSVRQRLERYYPETHHFSISGQDGTQISILIPCEFME